MAKKCTVKFWKNRYGVDAILMYRGRTLNYLAVGRSPTITQLRTARARLMKGCEELASDRRRGLRWSKHSSNAGRR